jgi:serine/threonine protein kinase
VSARTMAAMNPGGPSPTLIDGRFELLERLGGGGMGLVWRAVDVLLQREVALKEVRPPDPASLEFDPEGARVLRERVLREARALARLHHPNVVTIFHIVDTPELAHPWLVMELVTGGSLEDRLKRGPLEPRDAARVGRGVLGALRAAHEAGIQHRDVKPANVLLRPDGTPVLTDFGIAALRESTALTATGSLIGSPEFIAPERLRGEEGNPASDLWSLGIMIYAAAEGYSPLRRTTTMATLAAVLDEPIPAPVRSGPLLPALSAVLVRDPSARCGYDRFDRLLAEAQFGTDPGPAQSSSANLAVPYRDPRTAPLTGAATAPNWAVAGTNSGTGTWQGPGYGYGPGAGPGPGSNADSDSGGRPDHRRRNVIFATSIAGTAIAGVLGAAIWTLGQSPQSAAAAGPPAGAASAPNEVWPSGGQDGRNSGGPGGGETWPPAAVTSAPAQNVKDLLTPAGMTALIADVRSVMGTTRVTDLTVYPDSATGDVILASNHKLYDDFEFSDGQGSDGGPGGTLDSSDKTVDLTTFDWSTLPGLISKAKQDFTVTGTPMIYIIVDPDWADDAPTIRVYVTDAYGGGGYITANAKGEVTGKF